MARITAKEYELLGFFEVEPVLREAESDWLSTESTYAVTKSGIDIRFTVHPSYRDVKIEMSVRGEVIYDFFAMGVGDVSVGRAGGYECLTVLLDREHSIDLFLSPSIRIKQYTEVET